LKNSIFLAFLLDQLFDFSWISASILAENSLNSTSLCFKNLKSSVSLIFCKAIFALELISDIFFLPTAGTKFFNSFSFVLIAFTAAFETLVPELSTLKSISFCSANALVLFFLSKIEVTTKNIITRPINDPKIIHIVIPPIVSSLGLITLVFYHKDIKK